MTLVMGNGNTGTSSVSVRFFRPLIRSMVVRTSFTPFLEVYKLIYWAIAHAVVLLLRRHEQVKAVYLRRGYAKGEWVPGVSDIDLGVVVDGLDSVTLEAITRTYRRLARFVPVLDDQLDIVDEALLQHRYGTPRNRYRLLEGKATWKFLYGKNYLAQFADLPLEDLYGGLYGEFKVWWTILALPLLQTSRHRHDRILRNSICYKVVCEILKAELALNHGVLTFKRREALELAVPHLPPEALEWVAYFRGVARAGFLRKDPAVVDNTKDFFVTFMDRFHRQFSQHPYASAQREMSLVVDGSPEEMMYGERERTHFNRLIRHVNEKWGDSYLGAHLACGCYFEMDELLLMLEIEPARIPSDSDLLELYALHTEGDSDLVARIHVFLLTPHSAFQIDADYDKGWRTIFSACLNPEVFALLRQGDFTLDGRQFDGATGFPWSQGVADYFLERIHRLSFTLERKTTPQGNNLQFSRIFWKLLQCELICRSVNNQSPSYPLTIPAIRRGLTREGMSLPDGLTYLVDGYRDAVMQRKHPNAVTHTEAMAFLRGFASAIRNPVSC